MASLRVMDADNVRSDAPSAVTTAIGFTPGRWEASGRFSYDTADGSDMFQWNVVGSIGGKDGRTIAEVGEWKDRPNAEADARLIAAAPELLDTLEQVAAFLGDTTAYLERSRDEADNAEAAVVVNRVQIKVLAAIAEARGEERPTA